MNIGTRLSSAATRRVNRSRYQRLLRSTRRLGNNYAGPSMIQVDAGPSTQVLVISPHQDDEVIGCGGTLRLFVEKGSRVKVVYMTDGSIGGPSQCSDGRSPTRMLEAERGLRRLGIDKRLFLDHPDGELAATRSNVEEMRNILMDNQPDALFIPFYLDAHPDHAAAARIVGAALKGHPGDPVCFSYEVWTTLTPNALVDVTEVMDRKIGALGEHRSQIAQRDYVEKIGGLNSYRSMGADGQASYCEGFILQSKKEFLKMLSWR